MERWNGRIALVTGASTGIGAAICRALLKEGLVVIGCARNVEKIRESAKDVEAQFPGKLHAIKCDLAVEKEIIAMFEEIYSKFGRLDICINNAGVCINSPLLMGDSSDWRNMLEVNILALCICTREAVKLMRDKEVVKEGQIIHIGSIGGHNLPDSSMPGFNFYCGSKLMIRMLTDGLRHEIRDGCHLNHIRVASVSPGLTETQLLIKSLNPDIGKLVYESTPCLSPNNVADAVIYILQSPPSVNVQDVLVAATEK